MINDWHRGEAGLFYERGEALEQAGRLDEAMSEFKRAIHADPGLAEAHLALGFHYRRKNLLSKAAEEFRTATSLAPSYDSYFNLGHVLVDLGQPGDAIAAFRQCLAHAPDDPAVAYEIAYAHYLAGEFSTALEQLGALQATSSDDWELYYLAGSCELALGRYAAAQAAFERAQETLPVGEEDDGLQEALEATLRYQEFADLKPEDVKAGLYAEHGVACLGTLGDDGLHIAVSSRKRLSYQDLGRMLQRFHALRLNWRWRVAAVVAVDQPSTPLALALAQTIRAPLVEPHVAPPEGLTMVVWATVSVPELLGVVVERIPGPYVTFVAALDQASLRHLVPDIVGLVTAGEIAFPWDPEARQSAQDLAAREIVGAVKALADDETLAAQIRYYAQHHRRLRFLAQ